MVPDWRERYAARLLCSSREGALWWLSTTVRAGREFFGCHDLHDLMRTLCGLRRDDGADRGGH
jgi:hypothetical protein